MNKDIVDYKTFQKDTGLDESTIRELYQIFVHDLLEEMDRVISESAAGEYDRLFRSIHNIKGISSSYRAFMVYENSKKIDIMLKHKEYEGLNIYIIELQDSVKEAAREITDYFSFTN